MTLDKGSIRELEARSDGINRDNPVTVTVTWDEWLKFKHGVLLLRRIQGNTRDGDLIIVDECVTAFSPKIRDAFAVNPGQREIREQIDSLYAEASQDPRTKEKP